MSLEDFQIIDNNTIDNSIVKRDYTKVYNQSGANLNDSNHNVEFISVKITIIIRLVMLISNSI